ncbi:RGCVC family protein [Actinomycetospora sp.]|jgi:hypothetical protein|uniref:RGCVC family protein n=1 Tax=Actinomycetospora sp. TaxID=1872135 RepID=UPI002F410A13
MTEPEPQSSGSTTAAPEAPPGTCSVCPHPWDAHDALGRRYCSASMASSQSRGCICPK